MAKRDTPAEGFHPIEVEFGDQTATPGWKPIEVDRSEPQPVQQPPAEQNLTPAPSQGKKES